MPVLPFSTRGKGSQESGVGSLSVTLPASDGSWSTGMGVEDAVDRRERYRTKAQVHPERDVNLTGATVKWQDYGRRVSDVGNLLMTLVLAYARL